MIEQAPILEIRNLRKLYKNGRGVKSMSFTLSQGDIFGLLGTNGSGKTTAIRSICGLCAFEGEITLFGESVADHPREALRRVGGIIESPSYYGNLTALQNLQLAAKYYGMTKAETADAATRVLDIVGLSGYRRERVERFSLGMKARLGLALCFISNPGFMALDEPLNGLDIEGMVEVRNIIIDQAARSGAVFLISSHLASEIEKTCNLIGVMDEGELLETARMHDLLQVFGSVEDYYLSVIRRHRDPGQGDSRYYVSGQIEEAGRDPGQGGAPFRDPRQDASLIYNPEQSGAPGSDSAQDVASLRDPGHDETAEVKP